MLDEPRLVDGRLPRPHPVAQHIPLDAGVLGRFPHRLRPLHVPVVGHEADVAVAHGCLEEVVEAVVWTDVNRVSAACRGIALTDMMTVRLLLLSCCVGPVVFRVAVLVERHLSSQYSKVVAEW